MIGFNKPYLTGKEFEFISQTIQIEKLSGNGYFTKRCHDFFENRFGFKKCLLTHSATAALEMTALLIDIRPGDEVIMPSYTFVSTANAFLLRGAKIVFGDCREDNPNMDVQHAISLITARTKAIVVVHYAGIACDMDPIMEAVSGKNIFVIEDAAQAIDSYYKGRPLGSIGHLAAFSFHETKNITSGEGGMLVINDEQFVQRSEIIWEKGTNRAAFSRAEIRKYEWVDLGSSFLPSELTAAFLYAQLLHLDDIQNKRRTVWQEYFSLFSKLHLTQFRLPVINDFATNNGHIFYLTASDAIQRDGIIDYLKHRGIQAIFHYIPLHRSPYFLGRFGGNSHLPNAEYFGNTLLRLPLFASLSTDEIRTVVDSVAQYAAFSERQLGN
jgi:dTDP-4-amino-4,6-dideoxygalactose transaminase